MHFPTVNMLWYTLIGCDSFIYKIPMHRKKVRLRYYLLHTLCCLLMCFKVLNIFIGMITPWDPGLLLSYITYKKENGIIKSITHTISLFLQSSKPSYMAIKKALYRRQPEMFLYLVIIFQACCSMLIFLLSGF
jgi:hypothetical protein